MAKKTHFRISLILITVFLSVTGLSGCSSKSSFSYTQPTNISRDSNHQAVSIAHDMIGAPYRYGGADPRGFDCSGLVYYAYRNAGIEISRTTSDQYRQTKRVHLSELRPGDLIFFAISRNKPSHVGIYAGEGKFIHAPSSNKRVSYAYLDDFYWKEKFIGTGRI